jgi:hypothetical protein
MTRSADPGARGVEVQNRPSGTCHLPFSHKAINFGGGWSRTPKTSISCLFVHLLS